MKSVNIKSAVDEKYKNYYSYNELQTLLLTPYNNLITNLVSMGVEDASNSMSFDELIGKIKDVPPTLTGITLSSNLTCNVSSNNIGYGGNLTVTGVLTATYDDTTNTNVDLTGYLQGATIEIYNGETLIDTVTTNSNGEYSSVISIDSLEDYVISAFFDGTNDYSNCNSNSVTVTVYEVKEFTISTNKTLLSVYNDDSATITTNITLNNNGVSNQNVNLYCFNENTGLTLLDTITTNNNGIATYTYKPSSVGIYNLILEYDGEYKTLEIEKCYYYNNGDTTTGLNIQSGVTCTSDGEWITITTSTSGEKFVLPPVCFTGTDEWEISFQFDPVNYTSQAFGLQMENCNTWTYSGESAYTSYSGTSFNNCMGGGTTTYAMTSNDITTFRRSNGYWIILVNGTEIKRVSKNWTNQRIPGFYTNSGRVQHLKNIKINGLTSDGLFLGGDTSLSLADEDSTFLTAKLIVNGVGVSGVTVTFYKDNSIFGTGVTDSNGVAICNNIYESQGVGEIDFTCTATVNNTNLTSNTLTVTDMGLFSVSSDKTILSYNDDDSATITVSDADNINGVVYLYNDTTGVLIDTLTDNNNGIYSYNYSSQGLGDVTFRAESLMNTGTVTIEDCLFYDDCINNKSSDYIYFNSSKTGTLIYNSQYSVPYYYITVGQNTGHVPVASVTGINGDFCFEIETQGYNNQIYALTLHLSPTEYLSYNFYSSYIAKYLYPSEQKQGNNLSFTDINNFKKIIITKTGNNISFTVYDGSTEICSDNYTLPSNYQNQPLTPCISPYGYSNHRYNDVTFKNVKIKLLQHQVNLSSNKSVISSYDEETVTLTTDIGVTGETISLYANNQLLGNMTDNLDGTYSYNYNSQGVGDITFYAKSGNLTSENLLIEDCYFARMEELTYVSSHTSDTITQMFNDLSFSSNNFIVEWDMKSSSGGIAFGVQPISYIPSLKHHITLGYNGASTYLNGYIGKESSGEDGYNYISSPSFSSYYSCKIVKDGNTIELYVNNVLKGTYTRTYLNNETDTFIFCDWKNGITGKIKNIKIKL